MNAPYQKLYDEQQRFFHSGATRSVAFRKKQLSRLEEVLRAHEGIIEEAMMADLRKHPQEVYTTELGGIYEEIRLLKKSIRQWMRPQKVSHPLYLLPGKSTIFPEPLGNVLVISPWNYPFLLSFRVAVGAIAAGNTVLLKPSELAARSAEVIEKIVNQHFPSEYFHVINGEGATVIPALLLHHHFDHVFFTGSTQVGSKIMEMAAKHLSPVSLELGGKSPCIVTDDANIPVAAKRIVWGKMVCSGQTCVAPDYLIVHASVKDKMIAALIRQFETAYGVEPRHSESLGRIINRKRFDTLAAYLKEGRIIYGGTTDAEDLFISPTLMDNISPDAKIMQEEIFGPILPIFTYNDPEEALQLISKNPYPLALYVFATKPSKQQFFIDNVRFGGGGINETVVHLGNSELPFGGISYSGHGAYLGKHSFDTFSHFKSILERSTWFEPSLRHAPFSSFKTNWWRKLLGRR